MTPFETLDAIRKITPEAVIGQANLNHEGLAAEIRERFAGDWRHGGVLQEPLLEAALPYISSGRTLDSLSGDLLHPSLVTALHGDDGRKAYRFRREQQPYAHQLTAWRHLAHADKPRSVLVTSGTGSGKTECFLVPILDHLARKASTAPGRLEGVEAIVLYPLNALIASQEERLRAWTAPFKGSVRFGLYNGMLPDQVRSGDAAAHPEAIADRKALRDSPPPILVTNVTMLEYMLLRSEDAPILEASQGKLRYIVIDEAHTYVGAQAAEIALLLRRVCLAFGVDPADVRFIATSATLGEGEDIEQTLRTFLSDVSGAPWDQVHVVRGHTQKPKLPPLAPPSAAPSGDDYAWLGSSPTVRPLLERLYNSAIGWSELSLVAQRVGLSPADLAVKLSTAKSPGGEALAPLRIHSFHRAVPGLWSCLNPSCERPRPEGWAFGSIHYEPLEVCSCGAPTFEIVACQSCGEAFLDATETSANWLRQPRARAGRDEFSIDADESAREDGDDDDATAHPAAGGRDRLIAAGPLRPGYRRICVEVKTGEIHDRHNADSLIDLHAYDYNRSAPDRCPACGTSAPEGGDLIRPLRFGAPFILSALAPQLLIGAASPDEARDPQVWEMLGGPPPSQGRQLLSFTDSRQGTARFSAKLQIAAERAHVRSVIYHAVQDSLSQTASPEELEAIDAQITQLSALVASTPVLEPVLQNAKERRSALIRSGAMGLPWETLVSRLAERQEVSHWMRGVWARRDARFETEKELAEFLLLREFARRPPRANTPETLGLARLRFSLIDDLPDAKTPSAFRSIGGTPEDWRDYLYLLLTFAVRGRMAVRVDREMMHWVPPGQGPRDLRFEPAEQLASFEVAWPRLRSGALGRLPFVLTLLEQAYNISLDDPMRRQDVRDMLKTAWETLGPLLTATASTKYRLDFRKAHVAPVTKAFFCPVTRRILDVTLKGLTPYGAHSRGEPGRNAEPVMMPRHPVAFMGADKGAEIEGSARRSAEAWLATDPTIALLRRRGAWRDVTDRIALFSDYFRSAEHSAQQPPKRLRRYEMEFRGGGINVLNCSTTMEMGVDIGSVSHVMMTNLPPAIANYRQRVGRAGRRGQALSMAFTFCKDRPLDHDAFRNPLGYLARVPRPPKVALDSRVIVQRHVNALLFSGFAKSLAADAIKLQAGPFFGCDQKLGSSQSSDSTCDRLINWIRRRETQTELASAIERLTRKSVLKDDMGVFEDAAEAFVNAQAKFTAEWSALQALAPACVGDQAASKRLQIQLRRLCSDYLLSVLASLGVLPGHGFPTDVVSFIVRDEAVRDADADAREQTEERARFNSYPQRQLDVAIREYAPGSEVVLDGLVHRSAGVTLNWKRPAGPDNVKDVQAIRWRWRCQRCGESGSIGNRALGDRLCPACLMIDADWKEYLQPAGFAVDLREAPHADADVVSFVRPEPTKVSVGQANWQFLSDPSRGRRRSSREGGVFFCNAGAEGDGYAICLACGRADAPPDQAHRPLLGAGAECDGSHRSFARKQVLLGHEIRTDVFEFQPAGWNEPGGAVALAAALREALAQRLGVEASEMGLAAEHRLDAADAPTQSIFLFDKASGGAGFAVQAAEEFAALVPEVRRILDCSVEGCVTGCPACVLAGDLTDDQVEILDRQVALALIETLASEGRPNEIDLIGANALICESALTTMTLALEGGARRVILRIAGALDIGLLAQSDIGPAVERWSRQGRGIVLGVDVGALENLDAASRMQLRDLVNRWNVDIEEGAAAPFANGAALVAEACMPDGESWLVAGRDEESRVLGAGWGVAVAAPLVRVKSAARWHGEPVAMAKISSPADSAVRHLDQTLDGPIGQFGGRAASLIREALQSSGVDVRLKVSLLDYEDRYICSPLVLRLCLDTLSALTSETLTPIRLRTWPLRPRGAPAGQLFADWNRRDHRIEVAEAYGRRLGHDVELTDEKEIGHARKLTIGFADGSKALLILDQGFGPWKCERSAQFDFQRSPEDQAAQLARTDTLVFIGAHQKTYIVADRVMLSTLA